MTVRVAMIVRLAMSVPARIAASVAATAVSVVATAKSALGVIAPTAVTGLAATPA
jgi:hypothetical protein